MKEITYTITDPQGVHARPAGLLVKEAAKYPCMINISAKGKTADAKKIFGIMGLGVKQNDEITVSFDGEQEEEASSAVSEFLKNNL